MSPGKRWPTFFWLGILTAALLPIVLPYYRVRWEKRTFLRKPFFPTRKNQHVHLEDPVGPLYIGTVRQNFGRGVGYHTGYSSMDFLFMQRKPLHKLSPFVDVRGHHMDDNTWAANLGVGFKYKVNRFCTVFGMNAYYDYRNFHGHSFNQIGVGLEVYSPHWSVRANGYIPIGETEAQLMHHKTHLPGGLFIEREKNVYSLGGADLRIGAPFIHQSWVWSWIEAGPYFYRDFFGGLGQVTFRFADILRLKFGVTYDPVFRARAQGEVALVFYIWKAEQIQILTLHAAMLHQLRDACGAGGDHSALPLLPSRKEFLSFATTRSMACLCFE